MKRTNHVLTQLPDYLVGGLGRTEKSRIEQHLKTCKSCHDEYSTLTAMWAKLGLLPDETPSQKLRAKFYADLNEYKTAYERQRQPDQRWVDRLNAVLVRLWPRQPAVQLGLAVLCLMAGYVIGFRIDGGGGHGENGDVAQLRAEVQNMQRLVTMSLLKTESASDRIQGANWTERIARPDEGVLAALFERLNYDLNVNVRLAALDALSKFYVQPEIRQSLLNSLLRQTSPLVQLAIIEVIADAHDKQAVDVLNQLLQNPDLNKTVKEQVKKYLKELGS